MRVIVHINGEKLIIAIEESDAFLASFGEFLATGMQNPDHRWHLQGASADHTVLFRYAAIARIDVEHDVRALGVPYVAEKWV